jgi:hypothetical protein
VKTHPRQSNYKKAQEHIMEKLWEQIDPVMEFFYQVPKILGIKFYLCGALADAAVGNTEEGMDSFEQAVVILDSIGNLRALRSQKAKTWLRTSKSNRLEYARSKH